MEQNNEIRNSMKQNNNTENKTKHATIKTTWNNLNYETKWNMKRNYKTKWNMERTMKQNKHKTVEQSNDEIKWNINQ